MTAQATSSRYEHRGRLNGPPRVHRAWFGVVLFGMVACRTGDEPAGAYYDDPEVVQISYAAAIFPALLVNWSVYFASAPDLSCPEFVLDGAGAWTATGECTTEGGYTYSGSGEGTGLLASGWAPPFGASWTGYRWEHAESGVTEVNGTQAYSDDDGVLSSALRVAGNDSIAEYGFDYGSHSVGDFSGFLTRKTPWTVTGVVTIALSGSEIEVELEGAAAWHADCELEFGEGELTLTAGDDAATLLFDGATSCDGRAAYTTDGGSSGELDL